jgi:hypothetical protein
MYYLDVMIFSYPLSVTFTVVYIFTFECDDMFTEFYFNLNLLCNFRYFFEVRLAGRTKWSLVFRKGTFVTNLHYVFIYYILDNLIWLYFPLTPIEKSNRPIVYHVVRLPMRFKQGELKVSRHMYVEWSTRFVFK